MQFLTDLKFVLGLYKHLDARWRLRIHAHLVLIAFSCAVLAGGLSSGLSARPEPVAALDTHKPTVRSEPAPAYVPLPPTTVWPARGAITAAFGSRTPAQRHHSGIDIGGKYGDPITSFKAGAVIKAERSSVNSTGLGRYVMIDHGNGMVSVYGHLSTVMASVGQQVNTETVIGKEGSTGQAYGVHLHFEVRINDRAVDPRQYLPPR